MKITFYFWLTLLLTNGACFAVDLAGTESEDSIDEVFQRHGIKPGSIVIMDPSDPATADIEKINPFHQTQNSSEKPALNHAEKAWHIETVSEYKIIDLEAFFAIYGESLESTEVVSKRLTFKPLPEINADGFTFLGAWTGGVVSKEGYSDIFSLYDSPMGKIEINESDMLTSGGVVFITPESFNAMIGKYHASVSVYVDEHSKRAHSNVFWVNEDSSRMYNVDVGIDLNDDASKEYERILFDVLTLHFGQRPQ